MSLPPTLSYSDRVLYRRGRPHRILAGAIHYFRVHPDLWQDRIEKLAAMGANTLDTYVAWNFHQPRRDQAPDFTGWRDLARFVRLAGDAGLDVVLRPGPYICAEWDNGGFPAWALADPALAPRSSDPAFTAVVEDWYDALAPVLVPLQAAHGGPVVAVQVENEYGSYGDDTAYLRWNREALATRGITELLFTADGGTDYFLDGGQLPGTWAAATLGSRGPESAAVWARRRPDDPFFAVEFWNGWFDHWGEEHHTREAADAATEVRSIVELGGSVCLYMAHGGTNFGLYSGANHDGALQPTVTSYDSDAPIAEDGTLGPKFHAMREVFAAARGEDLPPIPEHLVRPAPTLSEQVVPVTRGAALQSLLAGLNPVSSVKPLSFEQLGLDRGLVHYTATAILPDGAATLRIRDLHDRAQVWIDGVHAGVLDERTAGDGLAVEGAGVPVRLEILVENQGRINYGPLFGQGKGILGGVLVNQRYVFHWDQRAVDLDAPLQFLLESLPADATAADPTAAETGTAAEETGTAAEETGTAAGHAQAGPDTPAFFHAHLEVPDPADTFIALPGFGKGFLWINGFLLGRYWNIGPQVTLYAPAPLLRRGRNDITVLELEQSGTGLQLRSGPELGRAGATHIEELG